MAAKKAGRAAKKKAGAKAAAKGKAAAKRKASTKKAAKAAPAKKASARAPAKKKAVAKKAEMAPEAAAKEKKQPQAPPASSAPAEAATKTPAKKGTVSVQEVTLGHVFALRPRVNKSFRPNDFMQAKRSLRDERYESLEEAARAVVEEALSLTRRDARPQKHRKRGR